MDKCTLYSTVAEYISSIKNTYENWPHTGLQRKAQNISKTCYHAENIISLYNKLN